MRFDKRVTFINEWAEEYDPDIGDTKTESVSEDRLASIRALSVKEVTELFGKVDGRVYSLVIKGLEDRYNYVIIDYRYFKVLTIEEFRNKTGYIVSEV